ncbi:putative sulfotransferase [Tistlia consotensis]|uniref:Putative sulfotransferase n=2 Tax=Tistlia TaxID=1321364 RepID=A0A1Y6C6D1_9PROT|nr:putative sulfotransferase [Tistlia consotensis USBA 355]SNR43202.1 putative sulfotransferase [Tistlia consotensis]
MLSNMVRCHRSLLSISEFFTSLGAYAFRGGVMTGAAVARRLGTLSPAGRALLENGLHVDEFLYPLGPGARYGAGEVPPILCTTLPHLTEDHERLWDELAAALSGRGSAPLGEHYRFVFDWLAERFGRSVWLERSGASLLFVPTLARLYPDARFVHIYRDGRDTALSMRRHHFFRLRVQMAELLHRVGLDPMAPFNVPGTSPWVPAAERLRFGFFDAERYRRMEIPLPAFGRFWSEMIERGLGYLAALPEERVLSLRYEDVVAEPEAELRRFIRFVGPDLEADSWLAEVSALPNAKAPAWQSLEASELAALERACSPGQRLLGYLPAGGA